MCGEGNYPIIMQLHENVAIFSPGAKRYRLPDKVISDSRRIQAMRRCDFLKLAKSCRDKPGVMRRGGREVVEIGDSVDQIAGGLHLKMSEG